ncbi:MAG TPA: serine hydrolase domain-containing protein [bacterium]|nr:serine hydrolase domain-containing protein [bacterium]
MGKYLWGPVIAAMLFCASCDDADPVNDTDLSPTDSDAVATDDLLDPDDAPLPDADIRFDPFIAALKKDLEKSDAYGVSTAVMKDGAVIFAAAYGSKDPAGKTPLTPDTLMQIGSTTKQMTAAGLLRKVEAGALALDDTIEELLPDLEFARDASWDDALTPHLLLSHQGGFYDWIPWNGPPDDTELADNTYGVYDELYYLMNPPGAFWNYSNPNFVLAGLITETLDTRKWPDIMREDLFVPLGMDRTFLRKSEVEKDGDYALSFGLGIDDLQSGESGPVTMEMMPDPGWGRPAGLVWTTPTQMMRWARFLMEGEPEVLADDLREKMVEEQVDTRYGMGTVHYGYGLFVERGYMSEAGDWYEVPVWEHGGNTLSFTNIFYMFPEQDFAVAICSSAYGTDFSHSLDAAVMSLAGLPAPAADAPVYTIDPARFDDHVGTYDDPNNVGTLIVTRKNDDLFVEAPDLAGYGLSVTPQLTAISSDIFYLYIDGTPYDITFIRTGEEGPSTYIRQRAFVATRVEDETSPRRAPSREMVERWLAHRRVEPPILHRP